MKNLTGRIRKITGDLKKLIYAEQLNITDIVMKDGMFKSVSDVDHSSAPWQRFSKRQNWGGKYNHVWFRMLVTIPESFHGKPLALQVATIESLGAETGVIANYSPRDESRWDIMNPQFVCYMDGKLVQGLDVNHTEIKLASSGKAGQQIQIDLQAYGGMTERKFGLFVDLVIVDEEIKRLYYDLNVPLLIAEQLKDDDIRKVELISALNRAVNLLDLRRPYSDQFYASLKESIDYTEEEIYRKLGGQEDIVATCIGHTHIDVAWLWTLEQTREKVVRSFSTVVKLMEEYPEYLFMSSQPQLYQFVKEDHPELYESIKRHIREGRWEAEGAMWLEADCNIASGESLVRQILFGTRFFEREFGVQNHVLWLPDVFGYSAALPQILKKSGIDYFMTSKISWNQFNQIPYDLFQWKGIDGTEILSYFLTTRHPSYSEGAFYTTYNGYLQPSSIMGGWQRFQQKELNHDILIAFGYGDGGGGPTREMLENARRMNRGISGSPKVRMGKAADFFKRLDDRVSGHPHLPRWVGELYLENHQGTYTSMGRNKRYNRKSELMFQDLECLSVMAFLEGKKYPQEKINQAWQTILLNQFHDILPGTAIKEVYDVSKEQYESILSYGREELTGSLNDLVSRISADDWSVVVFNTLSYERSDVAEFQIPDAISQPELVDETEAVCECQIINGNRALFFARGVPSKGYKTYRIREARPQQQPDLMSIRPSSLENDFFMLKLDEKGTITSFFDKINKRELIRKGERANKLLAFEDRPQKWDTWNIDLYYGEKVWEIDKVEAIEVLENGAIRGGLRIRKSFMDSIVCQDIFIYKQLPRVDFNTWIDWKEDQILVKAEFPVDINANKAAYEIQFGTVERPTHSNTSWELAQYEVCAHKWADLSEGDYGVSLLNDCKYGYDIKNGTMRLTLLKSGIAPYKEIDKEQHHFIYSVYPHAGNWSDGRTVQMASQLNVPLYTAIAKPQKGELPSSASLVSVNAENVIIDTVKKAEDSDDIIIRLYECCNRRSRAELTFCKNLEIVMECNLMEKEIAEIQAYENRFSFEIKPYEIKTFKLILK